MLLAYKRTRNGKGQAPGEAYVERLPFGLQKHFNSSSVHGRANVAKATLALVSIASLGAYMVGPSVVAALSTVPDATSIVKQKKDVDPKSEVATV
ncbi:hypothetical protein SK128_013221 [Halocaridina rubra]|uniref:Uncharacterized protein n=1 Tax=Halocaridina rubra TaxID=373956 RepID=A0AAN8WP55_HALRR